MPVHDSGDTITGLVQFRTSLVFETLVSFNGIATSWRLPELTDEAREILGRAFVDDVKKFYDEFISCCSLVELAVDYTDHDDVPKFLDFVVSMDDSEFAFYALGRHVPRERLADNVSEATVRTYFDESPNRTALEQTFPRIEWLDDVSKVKLRIVGMWRRYWDDFFSKKEGLYGDRWRESILEKQRILDDQGGQSLLENISKHRELPNPFPEGYPFTRVEVIPIYNSEKPCTVYYGYGQAHILYDCLRTEEHEREVEASSERSLNALKALGDENRLKILKLVSQHERLCNGKTIAQKLGLSTSVVSRHLGQLKSAGFISEFSPDNRSITYSFNLEAIRRVSQDLESFFKD